ncbi:MAG TPA: lysophospholipid acyltransferase family protein [Pseudonocardiaceae bacterium]|nr:lysophospholipid acyltransferase family protein [Pseudonocardiaceae bacterium]
MTNTVTNSATAEELRAQLPVGSSLAWHRIARWISKWIYAIPFRTRLDGVDHMPASGPVVVVINHSTLVEGPVLLGRLPRNTVFLVKRELFVGPAGWFLPKMGQLAVRRGEPDRAALMEAQRVLRAGGVIGVFPEGSRGEGDVTSAHNGAAWLAVSTNASVLPIACRGTYRAPGTRRRFRPKVDVLVGEPFTLPGQRGRAAVAAATEQIRVALATLVTELDALRAGSRPSDQDDSSRSGE